MAGKEESQGKIIVLGVQHVLAMYTGAVVVPLLVGRALGLNAEQLTYLIAIDILMCGIATILQGWRGRFFGIGMPIVLGCTFTAVGPMIAIGTEYGVPAIYGAIITAGALLLCLARFFGALVRFFPPVVTGSLVTIIGVTLIPVAINDLAGGPGSPDFGSLYHLGLGFTVLAVILIVYRFFRGFVRSVAVLIGLIAGTIMAGLLSGIEWQAVTEASWLHLPRPLYFGAPAFEFAPIITMVLVAMVSVVESAGVYLAVSDICGIKLTKDDLTRGYRSEGLAIFMGGIFNAFPYTTYSQNVGLVQLSNIRTAKVTIAAGFILIMLGLVPKIAAVTTIIPKPVMGGAMLAMFGLVMAYGIKILARVDFSRMENLLIISSSVGIGLGVTVVPQAFSAFPPLLKILMANGIVVGSVTAIALNLFFQMGRTT